MVKLLGLSGIVFLISLPIGNEIFFVSSFTVFIILTFLNMYQLWFRNGNFSKLEDYNFKRSIEEFKSKRYVSGAIRIIAIPMSIVGMIFAILLLALLWKMCVS